MGRCLAVVAIAVLSASCRSGTPGAAPRPDAAPDTGTARGPDTGPDPSVFPAGHPDEYWLVRIGEGEAQRRRVCDRGRNDRVTRALCGAGQTVTSLKSLFAALRLESGSFNLSLATNSSGLSFRTTSVLNPRLFLSSPLVPELVRDDMAVVAFSRGEGLVEMVAFDSTADELNFYLLSYRQTCAAGTCTTEEVLSAASEANWKDWTLYGETDLEDTPLDCLSCHRPDGAGSPRRLLMRDIAAPWFHWMPLPEDLPPCRAPVQEPRHLVPDLRADFERAFSPDGYGGHDIAASRFSLGHNLHSLIGFFNVGGGTPLRDEPFVMDSETVIDDWRCSETNATWRDYRSRLLNDRGLPVPYYRFDVLDRTRATSALEDFPAYLGRNRDKAPFALLRELIAEDAQLATGGIVDGAPAVEVVLRQACIRCHDGRAPRDSVRASFNVDQITPASAAAALKRLVLSEDSPFVMPPRRAGTLSPLARGKLVDLLSTQAR